MTEFFTCERCGQEMTGNRCSCYPPVPKRQGKTIEDAWEAAYRPQDGRCSFCGQPFQRHDTLIHNLNLISRMTGYLEE